MGYDDKIYRGWKYKLGKGDPHIPNKDEGKLLRKLMSKNGMSEKEVRSIKKYRKLLSDASKKGREYNHRYWRNNNSGNVFWKRVTKKTGLVREHPVSKYVYNLLLKTYVGYSWVYYLRPINLSKHDLKILERYDLEKYKR